MKRLVLSFILCVFFLPCVVSAEEVESMDNIQLSEMLEKNRGKVIMINFFATWCPPCRVELPELVKLRDAYPESEFFLIGFSVDEDKSAVLPFIKQAGVNYPVYMATKSITDRFNVSSVPHNAFFAPGGQLVISEPGMAETQVMKEAVDDLLKRK